MKAIVKAENKPGLQMQDVPVPTINGNDVLIKIHKTSICGTDVHIYKWDDWAQRTVPVPLTIGHEFVGHIEAVGKNVHHLKVGDRVSGEGHLTCGTCPNCLKGLKHICVNTKGVGYHTTGCFAEYFALPAENVFKIPDTISDELASIFDPFGNAMHTALSFDLVGEDVLITGAGPIGIMASAIARKAGARTVFITDMNPYRLDMAKKMGATHAVDISKESINDVMKSAGVDYGFTFGMEMSGAPAALNMMIETAQHGANIALLGLLPSNCQINWDRVIFKMLTLKGIYGREIFSTWFKMIHLLESGLSIEPVITHRFKAEEFEKGFEAMMSGQSGKVILDWS
jgi:threonine 3-dehydrogenase